VRCPSAGPLLIWTIATIRGQFGARSPLGCQAWLGGYSPNI
jgi:hypothetical protein